jgi:hypothetical protein
VNERLLRGTVAADTVSRGGAVAIRSGGHVYVSSGGVFSAATISAGAIEG